MPNNVVQLSSDSDEPGGTAADDEFPNGPNKRAKKPRQSVDLEGYLKKTTREIEAEITSGMACVVKPNGARFTAEYWKSFSKVLKADSKEQLPFIRCDKCKQIYKHTSKSGSADFHSHAKLCGESQRDLKKQPEITSMFSVTTVPAELKSKITAAVARHCARDSRSFSIAQGAGFQEMMETVITEVGRYGSGKLKYDIKELLPSHQAVSVRIEKEAADLRKELGKIIRPIIAEHGGSASLDYWSEDYTKTAYLGGIYHYIDNEWNLCQKLLFCSEFDCQLKKTGELTRDFFFTQIQQYGLTEEGCKKVVFVTDEGSNMVKAFELPNRTSIKRLNCSGHLMNTTVLNTFNRKPKSKMKMPDAALPCWKFLTECKSLVTHCKQTYVSRQLRKTLKQDVETRWHTKYDMLQSIIDAYEDLERLLTARGERNLLPGPKDKLVALAEIFRPFKAATEVLSAQKVPTLHLVAPTYDILFSQLTEAVVRPYPEIVSLQQHCLNIAKKKLVLNIEHKVALFLNPEMKHMPVLSDAEKTEVLAYIRAHLDSEMVPTPSTPVPSRETSTSKYKLDFQKYKLHRSAELDSDEVARYQDEKPPADQHFFDILKYWKEKEKEFPRLSKFAKSILVVPATSTAAERLFSQSGFMVDNRRTRLSADKLDDCLFVKYYWNDSLTK